MSLALHVHRFQVAQRRQATRAPVDQVVRAVDQSLFVEPHEDFAHHPRQFRRERELLPRPVAALPDLLHLCRDRPARLFLPLPHALFELFAPQFAVIHALFGKLPHDHPLRRDARVVRAREVQRVVPAHAVPAREDVNLRVLHHVPDVQRAGHVRRGNHDGEGRARRRDVGAEQRLTDPGLRPPWFDLLWFVGLCDFARHATACPAFSRVRATRSAMGWS